jgi:single-strand DNA-binding protein
MSDGLNKVLLFGNLGSDPELRVTTAGRAVLHVRLATSESYVDAAAVRQERTEWHDVTIWGKRGEALAKILTKGSRVLVEGQIRTSSWERDGVRRFRTEVVADNVFLASARRFEAADGLSAPLPTSPPPPSPPVQDDIPF